MAQINCNNCSALIPTENINIAEGVALCPACGQLSKLADLAADTTVLDEFDEIDISLPPSGCALHDDGIELRVSASARAITKVMATLVAAAFWNGIVSIFVLNAIAGLCHHLLGAVPMWLPTPMGGAGSSMPLGMVIFLCFFLIPFVAIGLMLIGICLTSLFGRCEVTVRGAEGRIFTGFGPIGWRRKFDASTVKSVQLGQAMFRQTEQPQACIVIETDPKDKRLATVLTKDRRAWMIAALRSVLVN